MFGKITRDMVIQFALMLVVLLGIIWAVNHYQGLQRDAQLGRDRKEIAINASEGIADGVTAGEVQAAVDAAIASGRDTYNHSTAEARRNEPTTATRDSRAVPDSRLRAFRERRLARERRGCAGGERQGQQCEGAAAER
jgi:hypothetical protein